MERIDAWKTEHQPFELNYHMNQGRNFHDSDTTFDSYWGRVFSKMFPDGVDRSLKVLDIGCGPRPVLKSLFDAIVCIEPLADKYMAFTNPEWWNGLTVYSQPAEVTINKLRNSFDLVWCWNCLDHTYDWKQILTNAKAYMKEGATFILATDHHPPGIGHPGFQLDEFEDTLKELFIEKGRITGFSERDMIITLQ